MRSCLVLATVFFTACSSSSKRSNHTQYDGSVPPASCDAPAAIQDVSTPTTVVGGGSAESCTRDELQKAADIGGTIVFNCGTSATTIKISSTVVFKKDTVLDGGGFVTLSGEGTSRILYLDSGYDQTTPRLVVQRLTFSNGNSPSGGDDTAVGGGAIYRDGGSLTVIDCVFLDNHAPSSGQDVAGGAIYAFGGGETVIVGSTFTGNEASNGGAVGSLNGDLIIFNSTFTQNSATGSGGNPGDGGCGGAVYMDGADENTSLCGVTIADNKAGAIGGGVFRVSNLDNGTFTMNRTTVDSNQVTPDDTGDAGGLYLQGLQLVVTNSTISRNQAYHNGGIWISKGEVLMINVTIAENSAFGLNGGGIWLSYDPPGTLVNCTIANNQTNGQSGAITSAPQQSSSSALTLKNTLVVGNTARWSPGCYTTYEGGGGNLQWPDGSLCTSSPLIADPQLGALGDNGGPTKTLVPGSASPARGLGTDDCPDTDQRGEPRGQPCTAGAVEVL